MCIICEGGTYEDSFLALDNTINRHGWAVQGVLPGAKPGWLYTIGLSERYLHRELVVVSCDIELADDLLNELGHRVRDGERFAAGMSVDTDYGDYELVEVHANQLHTSLIAMWHGYYQHVGRQPMSPRPLQVVIPDDFCDRHDVDEWRLDRNLPLLADRWRPPRRRQPRGRRVP